VRTTAEAEGRVGGAPPSRCDLWCTNDHSSLAITADTYTSVLPAVAQAAAEAVAGIVPRTAKKAADAGALSVGYQKAPREARMDVSRTRREAKGQVRGVGRLGFEPRTYGLKARAGDMRGGPQVSACAGQRPNVVQDRAPEDDPVRLLGCQFGCHPAPSTAEHD